MSREQLIEMAKINMAHGDAGTIPQTDDVLKVPVGNYFETERWQQEINKIFKRVPLMLAMTAELKEPGDYKAMNAGGVPVLISRTEDGEVKAFVNMCAHRGSQVMDEGCGNTHRFTCPYHAWSFNGHGDLISIYAPKDFGEIDKSQYGLTELRCLEKAGLIETSFPKGPGRRPHVYTFDGLVSKLQEMSVAYDLKKRRQHRDRGDAVRSARR